jgi:hypothetical protein
VNRLLSDLRAYRRFVGGTWERWYLDDVHAEEWFCVDPSATDRPHILCRGTPKREKWPTRRPLDWLAVRVPEWLRPHASSWQWYRRAIGGAWVLRGAILLPGCPEMWEPAQGARPSYSHRVFEREVWP